MNKISIIIPAYNSEKTISRCLESVFANDSKELSEVVVINDASKDNTKSVVESLIEKAPKNIEVKFINLNDNIGVQATRNVGLLKSTGNYIGFLDSDDEISNNFLSSMYSIINNNAYDIVTFNGEEIASNYTNIILPSSVIENLKKYGHLKEALLFGENGFLCTHVYKKSLLVDANLDSLKQLTFTEDLNINIEIAIKNDINFHIFDRPLYKYYLEHNSQIDRINEQKVNDALYVINRRYELVKSSYPELLEVYKTGNLKSALRLIHSIKKTKNFTKAQKKKLLKEIKSQESIYYTLKLGFKRFMKLKLKDKLRYILYK